MLSVTRSRALGAFPPLTFRPSASRPGLFQVSLDKVEKEKQINMLAQVCVDMGLINVHFL